MLSSNKIIDIHHYIILNVDKKAQNLIGKVT